MARTRAAREEHSAPTVNPVAEKRREEIARAAVDLFSEKGYFQTTIDDIASQLRIGKGLIYRYFKDKNDVLLHALCSVLAKYDRENVVESLAAHGPLVALQRMLTVHCAVSEEHTHEVVLAYRSTKDLMPEQRRHIKALETRIVADIRRCLEACIREGLMVQVNVRAMAYQHLIYGHTWALKNWALRKEFSAAEYVAQGERLLIVPFLTEAGRKRYKRSPPARSRGRCGRSVPDRRPDPGSPGSPPT